MEDTINKIELIDQPKSTEKNISSEKKVFNLDDSKEKNTEVSHFDFEPSKELIIREIESKPHAAVNEDIFNVASDREEETTEQSQPAINKPAQDDKHKERQRKLRELSYGGKANIDDMENVPAYKRKNINLSQKIPSADSEVARFTLSESEDGLEIKSNNKFLHDNVD